jgi:EAL domain-containing protein (putative c-di-GMP-specific phosphodiesterase class I)
LRIFAAKILSLCIEFDLEPGTQSITTSIVMTHNLKLRIIAEGVETEEQQAFAGRQVQGACRTPAGSPVKSTWRKKAQKVSL